MVTLDVLVGIAIVLGLIGVVVPLLPGGALVLGAVLVWAIWIGGSLGWVVFGVAALLVLTGAVVKYAVPGRRLQAAGIPGSTLIAGGVLGVIGFFVVPVVGLVLGFVLGVLLAEWHRLSDAAAARAATVQAVKAVGLGMLIELTFAMLAAATWVVGVAVR